MKSWILKWAISGIIVPVVLALLNLTIGLSDRIFLLFWPGSIVLMSLGTGPNEVWYVIYDWSVGITIIIFTYSVIGLFLRWVIYEKKRTDNELLSKNISLRLC